MSETIKSQKITSQNIVKKNGDIEEFNSDKIIVLLDKLLFGLNDKYIHTRIIIDKL